MFPCRFSLVILLLLFLSCSTDDDVQTDPDQFLNASVNGMSFSSDHSAMPIGVSRILMPSGNVNLHVKSKSAEGYIIEFLVDSYNGPGVYHFGDNYYNSSWLSFEGPARSMSFKLEPGGALNRNSNYIEIFEISDNSIEGKIGCKELRNSLTRSLAVMEGEFRLVFLN